MTDPKPPQGAPAGNASTDAPGAPGSASVSGAPTPQEARAAMKKRSIALAWALAAFVVIVFAVTLVRLQGDAANSWNYQAPTESVR